MPQAAEGGELTYVGAPAARSLRRLMVVGQCCHHRVRAVVGIAVWWPLREVPAAVLRLVEPEGSA